MILDSLENAARYYQVHPMIEPAITWLKQMGRPVVSGGPVTIVEGLTVVGFCKPGKSEQQALEKFECHDRNIDLQVCLAGRETMLWKARSECRNPKGPYDVENDVQFFADPPATGFTLEPGQFVIFFPEDVHAPMIGTGEIDKLVFKLAV